MAFKSKDGFDWEFTSIIAANVSGSEEGPCENDLTIMGNGSLLNVFRTDGGDGQPCGGTGHSSDGAPCSEGGHRMAPYGIAVSDDMGHSWKPVKLLPDSDPKDGIKGARAQLIHTRTAHGPCVPQACRLFLSAPAQTPRHVFHRKQQILETWNRPPGIDAP